MRLRLISSKIVVTTLGRIYLLNTTSHRLTSPTFRSIWLGWNVLKTKATITRWTHKMNPISLSPAISGPSLLNPALVQAPSLERVSEDVPDDCDLVLFGTDEVRYLDKEESLRFKDILRRNCPCTLTGALTKCPLKTGTFDVRQVDPICSDHNCLTFFHIFFYLLSFSFDCAWCHRNPILYSQGWLI